MGYIKGSTKLLLCQVLQGKVRIGKWGKYICSLFFKVYQCTQLITGADLQDVCKSIYILLFYSILKF